MRTKNILSALLLMVASLQTMWGQKFVIYKSDGQAIECNISELDSIVFAEPQVTYEWIDLGLPSGTLWATCNVGADNPEEYGDYFAWGETITKNNYCWETYKFWQGSRDMMAKYGYDIFTDYKIELDPADDAATVRWGNSWQIPSVDQWQELHNSSNTTITGTIRNGVKGNMIISKSNGKSIFLPAAGYVNNMTNGNIGVTGCYWSRSLVTDFSYLAYSVYFQPYSTYSSKTTSERYYGQSIRPVRVKTSN